MALFPKLKALKDLISRSVGGVGGAMAGEGVRGGGELPSLGTNPYLHIHVHKNSNL